VTVNAVASRLTELHRAQQLTISRTVAAHVLETWGTVDPAQIDRSWRRVAGAMAEIVQAGHAASLQAAAAYLHLHAALYGVTLPDVAAPAFNGEQVDTSLRVTGPVALKRATGDGAGLDGAMATASTMLAGSATRLALLGGRQTLADTFEQSDGIVGYRRVGDGHSCNFCSMLISRGAVYKTVGAASHASGARGNQPSGHAYHDHCGCTTEPLYAGQDEPADVAAAFERYIASR
jgi:hypothetical protein